MGQQINEGQVKNLVTDLAAKAPLASPAFTGSPTATTQAANDNSSKLSTTAYTDAAVLVETNARQAQANRFNANFFQSVL
jgi:hypothetical protein